MPAEHICVQLTKTSTKAQINQSGLYTSFAMIKY